MEPPVSAAMLQKAALTQNGTEGVAAQHVSQALERKLADYVASLQAEGSYGRQLNTPTALGSEATRLLKGYLEHTARLQALTTRKAGAMSESAEVKMASREDAETASLPGGPASSDLGPADSLRDQDSLHLTGLSDPELERAVQLLSEMLHFGVETTLISTATMNVTRAATTLIHGQ